MRTSALRKAESKLEASLLPSTVGATHLRLGLFLPAPRTSQPWLPGRGGAAPKGGLGEKVLLHLQPENLPCPGVTLAAVVVPGAGVIADPWQEIK